VGWLLGTEARLADGLGVVSAISLAQPTLPKAKRLDKTSRVPVLVEGFHMINNFMRSGKIA
jgi:hypothetical protein